MPKAGKNSSQRKPKKNKPKGGKAAKGGGGAVRAGRPLVEVIPAGNPGWRIVNNALQKVSFLAALPPVELASVAAAMDLVEYKKGEVPSPPIQTVRQ